MDFFSFLHQYSIWHLLYPLTEDYFLEDDPYVFSVIWKSILLRAFVCSRAVGLSYYVYFLQLAYFKFQKLLEFIVLLKKPVHAAKNNFLKKSPSES